MALDASGNLYVTDFFNHRVLKYLNPFTTDSVADDFWGQDGFTAGQHLRPTVRRFPWGQRRQPLDRPTHRRHAPEAAAT